MQKIRYNKRGVKMRLLSEIYEMYIDGIIKRKGFDNIEIKVKKREIEMLRKIQSTIEPNTDISIIEDKKPKIGNLYMFDSLFFVISDNEEYPYEVFIVSNFWELATNEDIIIESEAGDKWVIESIVRYVDDDILEKSTHIDDIDTKFIDIMKDYIHNNKSLPEKMVGMEASEHSFQEKFKKHEVKRSMILTAESLFYEEDEEMPHNITVSIKNSDIERDVLLKQEYALAAASYEGFIKTQFGEMIKKDGVITIKFDEQYIGLIAKIYANKKEIYSGILPERLNIETEIERIESLKEVLEIEFL